MPGSLLAYADGQSKFRTGSTPTNSQLVPDPMQESLSLKERLVSLQSFRAVHYVLVFSFKDAVLPSTYKGFTTSIFNI